jgi:hypothetical protein
MAKRRLGFFDNDLFEVRSKIVGPEIEEITDQVEGQRGNSETDESNKDGELDSHILGVRST